MRFKSYDVDWMPFVLIVLLGVAVLGAVALGGCAELRTWSSAWPEWAQDVKDRQEASGSAE